jgi:hypothetical protein
MLKVLERIVQKSLRHIQFRELAQIVYQFTDIYLKILFLIYNALVQPRDLLFKYFGKDSNQDCFQNCSRCRDHLVFGSKIHPFSFFLQVPNKKKSQGTESEE